MIHSRTKFKWYPKFGWYPESYSRGEVIKMMENKNVSIRKLVETFNLEI